MGTVQNDAVKWAMVEVVPIRAARNSDFMHIWGRNQIFLNFWGLEMPSLVPMDDRGRPSGAKELSATNGRSVGWTNPRGDEAGKGPVDPTADDQHGHHVQHVALDHLRHRGRVQHLLGK